MSINATDKGGDYTPVPAGNYVARCVSMVHIGTIVENYGNELKKQNKVRLSFETPEDTKEFVAGEGQKPYLISKDFTLSMSEKSNLRKFLVSWRGKDFTKEEAKSFDVTKLLGKPCMLNVIHKTSAQGRTYADISSISTLPKKLICPDQINPSFELNYEDQWSVEKFNSLPDFIKDKMKLSEEYRTVMNPEHVNTPTDDESAEEINDDLPF
jgi:hypothetical protein